MEIQEVNRAHAAGQQIEHSNGDNFPIKTVYLVVGAEFLRFLALRFRQGLGGTGRGGWRQSRAQKTHE